MYAGTVMPSANMIAKSAINHSGLFSETRRHLSPSERLFFKTLASFWIIVDVSPQVYFFLFFGFNHSKKAAFGFSLLAL